MKKIEILNYFDEGKEIKALFVDGEVFDWNINIFEIEKANQACKDAESRRAIHANVQNHFLMCFETFMGKKYELKEIVEAIEKGEI